MARMSDVLSAARGIISDDDYDVAMSMLDSENFKDKAAVSEGLKDLYGWDPLTHHDRIYLESAYKDLLSKAPDSMKSTLTGLKDEIIDATLASKSQTDEEYLYQLLIANIAAETGWTCQEEVIDMTTAIFDEVCGQSYGQDEGEDVGEDSDDSNGEDESHYDESDEDDDSTDFEFTIF